MVDPLTINLVFAGKGFMMMVVMGNARVVIIVVSHVLMVLLV